MPVRLKKLPRSFYLQPTLTVAKKLLGLFFVRRIGSTTLIGKIVEVEAYLGRRDPASHTYRGKTKRNEVMFRRGGHLYVYFTYGMHFCANVVTEETGIGHAVLLRAVEPIQGVAVMRKNRKQRHDSDERTLCSGPARLCQAFGIGRMENGVDLCGSEIWIARDVNATVTTRVSRSSRVGITSAKHHRWRFFLKNNPFVSRGKPAA